MTTEAKRLEWKDESDRLSTAQHDETSLVVMPEDSLSARGVRGTCWRWSVWGGSVSMLTGTEATREDAKRRAAIVFAATVDTICIASGSLSSSGTVDRSAKAVCPKCGGSGDDIDRASGGRSEFSPSCSACGGTGKILGTAEPVQGRETAELTIELPLSPTDDTEITCLYCRAQRPCEYGLTVRRDGERSLVGLHAACLEPFRKRNRPETPSPEDRLDERVGLLDEVCRWLERQGLPDIAGKLHDERDEFLLPLARAVDEKGEG